MTETVSSSAASARLCKLLHGCGYPGELQPDQFEYQFEHPDGRVQVGSAAAARSEWPTLTPLTLSQALFRWLADSKVLDPSCVLTAAETNAFESLLEQQLVLDGPALDRAVLATAAGSAPPATSFRNGQAAAEQLRELTDSALPQLRKRVDTLSARRSQLLMVRPPRFRSPACAIAHHPGNRRPSTPPRSCALPAPARPPTSSAPLCPPPVPAWRARAVGWARRRQTPTPPSPRCRWGCVAVQLECLSLPALAALQVER
jgi:hypothetical protein